MKRSIRTLNWPRIIIQLVVLGFILYLVARQFLNKNFIADFEAYCPFGGIQALGSYLISQALSCTMTSAQIGMGVLLFLGVLVFSKLFCSYICPIGTVSEWLGKLGARFKVRYTITGLADRLFRVFKYVLLFITFYFTLQSNELFCKKYDPYYALATGFSADVVVLYAVIAIAIAVLGAIFIRLFWCKYLCPLAALSNIFKFSGFFLGVMILYIAALLLGAEISYVWPLAILCAGGLAIELYGQKSKFLPVVKITRNATSCIDCDLCTKKCPQAIDVAHVDEVKHVDCNLCTDCVLVCPVKNTLQVNRRNSLKWISPIAVTALVAIGLIVGSLWEVPTINQQWGDEDQMATAGVYAQSGLKNIKCYGSSAAFANQMRRVPGVLGVATYVKHHRIKIYYDPAVLDEVKIQKAIFTPMKTPIKAITREISEVTEVTLKLENFFDAFDFNYLTRLLSQNTNALGILSEFDCPIIVKIYFPVDSVPDEKTLTGILESEKLTYEVNGVKNTVKLGYAVAAKPEFNKISRGEYISRLFTPFEQEFNKRESYSEDVLQIYQIPLGKNAGLRARFPYLVSHLSNDDGIVAFSTLLDSAFTEQAQILFVDTLTNGENIFRNLNADSLLISYASGEKEKVKSMFHFENEGVVLKKE